MPPPPERWPSSRSCAAPGPSCSSGICSPGRPRGRTPTASRAARARAPMRPPTPGPWRWRRPSSGTSRGAA
eukprot:6009929-Alexandrium_andersonii.AAC.1